MFGISRKVTTGGARCRYPGGELHQTAGGATQTWQTQTIGEGLLVDKPAVKSQHRQSFNCRKRVLEDIEHKFALFHIAIVEAAVASY